MSKNTIAAIGSYHAVHLAIGLRFCLQKHLVANVFWLGTLIIHFVPTNPSSVFLADPKIPRNWLNWYEEISIRSPSENPR